MNENSSKRGTQGRQIYLVVAMTSDYVIGYSNQLPWKFSLDLKRFRRITTPHTVIMGRKTYESIGKRLPKRQNIIVTTQKNYRAEGCLTASSLHTAIEHASTNSKIFVIGGGQLYREALPTANRLYLTVIELDRTRGQGVLFEPFRGDTHFPPINSKEWKLTNLGAKRRASLSSQSLIPEKDQETVPAIYFRFVILERRKRSSNIPIPGITDSKFDISWDDKKAIRKKKVHRTTSRRLGKKRTAQKDFFAD
jgi:dihydrofolate reductase